MFKIGLPSVSGGNFDVRLRGLHRRPRPAGNLCRAALLRFMRAACRVADGSTWLGSASSGDAHYSAAAGPGRPPCPCERGPGSSGAAAQAADNAEPACRTFSAGGAGRCRRHTPGAPPYSARTLLIGEPLAVFSAPTPFPPHLPRPELSDGESPLPYTWPLLMWR
jgi:hypothetical protein